MCGLINLVLIKKRGILLGIVKRLSKFILHKTYLRLHIIKERERERKKM
jgi:hypothetical protein